MTMFYLNTFCIENFTQKSVRYETNTVNVYHAVVWSYVKHIELCLVFYISERQRLAEQSMLDYVCSMLGLGK